MANQYKYTAILDSISSNLGRKRIYISYQDDITKEQKAIPKLYSEMDLNQAKYDDMMTVITTHTPSGVPDSGLLEGTENLKINYTSGGLEQTVNKTYAEDLTQGEKDKFDALRIYAESLMV